MKLCTSAIRVNINLKNGLYRLPCNGGAGKTYLYKILKSLRVSNKNIQCVSYDSNKEIKDIKDGIVICDRLDMYQSKSLIDKLSDIADRNIVLMDIKSLEYLPDRCVMSCTIKRREGEIDVDC